MVEPPLFGYNEQFFRFHPEYTVEELSELQSKIKSIIETGSTNIEKQLDSKMKRFAIHGILQECKRRGLVKREKLGYMIVDNERHVNYRYYT